MQDHRKLRVWQEAHALTLKTYAVSAHLDSAKSWPLQNQLLRAAISVPSNIAEGRAAARILTSGGSWGTPWDP